MCWLHKKFLRNFYNFQEMWLPFLKCNYISMWNESGIFCPYVKRDVNFLSLCEVRRDFFYSYVKRTGNFLSLCETARDFFIFMWNCTGFFILMWNCTGFFYPYSIWNLFYSFIFSLLFKTQSGPKGKSCSFIATFSFSILQLA